MNMIDSGTPFERPLERPFDNVNLNINVLISTPYQRPALLKGHFSEAKGWPHKRGSTVLVLSLPQEVYTQWYLVECRKNNFKFPKHKNIDKHQFTKSG